MSKSELISNYNNNFIANNQVNSVDAYVNTNKTYDYYKNKLNRNSIDNKGMNINGFVHVGRNYGNAFGTVHMMGCSLAMATEYTSLLLQNL